MTLAELFLPEFDQEMAGTRKVLDRVPDDKLDWKAHPKSNTIGWVAKHLAEIPGWVALTVNSKDLDLSPPGGAPLAKSTASNRAEFLELFDKKVVEGRKVIAETSDAKFAEPWTLLSGGTKIFTLPKHVVLRNFVLNHTVHHRAILCVYYRLNDISVPGLYGPSGDEG